MQNNQPQEPLYLHEDHGYVQSIIFNNPKKNNMINMEALEALHKILDKVMTANPKGCPIVFKAKGKHFCAGGDLLWIKNEENFFKWTYSFYHLTRKIYNQHKFTFISLVQGAALGGGCMLGIMSKYSIVTEKTIMSMPETKLGTLPILFSLFEQLPFQVGRYMWYGSARFAGQQICDVGLANRFIESKNLDELYDNIIQAQHIEEIQNVINGNTKQTNLGNQILYLETISEIFRSNKLEEIYDKAEELSKSNPFAEKIHKELIEVSPLAVRISHMVWNSCFHEEELLIHEEILIAGHRVRFMFNEFEEGIQFVLKNKKPKWCHKNIREISESELGKILFKKQKIPYKPLL